MSKVIWKKTWSSAEGEPKTWEASGFQVSNVFRFDLEDEQLTELPEPRAYQVLNRRGLLQAAVGLQARELLAPLIEKDPYSVGLYCSAEKGPGDFKTLEGMYGKDRDDFVAVYKANRSPKRFFKEIINIPISHLGMFLGVRGPHLAFAHSTWACLHSLEQAELDLENGVIRAALVCAAFAIEDPVATMRVQRQLSPDATTAEGAAALVLVADGTFTDWYELCRSKENPSFGAANDLIHLAMEMEINDETRTIQ